MRQVTFSLTYDITEWAQLTVCSERTVTEADCIRRELFNQFVRYLRDRGFKYKVERVTTEVLEEHA